MKEVNTPSGAGMSSAGFTAAERPGAGEPALPQDRLARSAADAVGYLTRHIDPTGRYTYVYDLSVRGPGRGYNLLRHAGTSLELCRFVGTTVDDGSLLARVDATCGFLASFLQSAPRGGEGLCIAEKGAAKLGGAALGLLALAARLEVVGPTAQGQATVEGLATYLVSQQRRDGSFVSKVDAATGEQLPLESVYYAGEATLALCAAFRLTRCAQYLSAACDGAAALADRMPPSAAGGRYADHWLMKTLADLVALTGDAAWAARLSRIADPVASWPTVETLAGPGRHWLIGSSTTNLSTRVEALIAALQVRLAADDVAGAAHLLPFIRVGLGLCLQRQFGPQDLDLLARGGFRQTPGGHEVRIDYVHHPLGAMKSLIDLGPDLAPVLAASGDAEAELWRLAGSLNRPERATALLRPASAQQALASAEQQGDTQ